MLLQKKQASLIVKVVAILIAVAFVLTLVAVWGAPSYKEEGSSKLDPQREDYYQQSTARLEQDLRQNPSDLNKLIEAGNLYFDWGEELRRADDSKNSVQRLQQAVYYYQQALGIEPKNGDVRTDMAIACFYSGNTDKAITEANQVTAENPNHAKAYYNLGIFYRSKNQKDETVRVWEKYLELESQGEQAEFVKRELEKLKK